MKVLQIWSAKEDLRYRISQSGKEGSMIIDEYDDNTIERVREVCQELFHRNYITEFVFSPNESLKKANISYSFVMQHFDAVEQVLDLSGWNLHHDEHVRVLYLTSDYTSAKVVLNKIESYFLLALRLIYDDKKTQASASGEVFITVREIIEQLTTLGAVESVQKIERERALRTLSNKSIISRMTGTLGDIDARFAILPSIICAISADKTKSVLEMLSANTQEDIKSAEDLDDSEMEEND
jgi:hypothetical protein